MPKNIVLLSDGTGNSSGKLFKTNVWRLYQALDLADARRQVAFYDNGVGTASFKPFAILGGIFGFGLKRNVLDIYKFACRAYEPGDHIFGFGFSRGAFTIRIVAGLIARQGLVPYHGDEAQLARDAADAYRRYRERFNVTGGLVAPLRKLRNQMIRLIRAIKRVPRTAPHRPTEVNAIRFMGVWDTVGAYGGPIEEITRGIDYWLWPLSMPDRLMNAKILRACHALALDDERNSFWPVLWDDQHVGGDPPRPMLQDWEPPNKPNLPEIDRQRLSQVWFTGMHTDVGGGYAEDGLAYVTLDWMMDRAEVYDLQINGTARADVARLADQFGKLNDSRHGLSGYYRYKPRKLVDVYAADVEKPAIGRDVMRVAQATKRALVKRAQPAAAAHDARPAPMIHESVFQRIKAQIDGYAPIVLPESYRITTKAGAVAAGTYENATQASRRANGQESAWNWVWARRIVYFLTLFATLGLAGLPPIEQKWPGLGPASPAAFVIPLIDLAGGFLPSFVSPWLTAFKSAPEYLVVGAVLVVLLLLWGGGLQQKIRDAMRQSWRRVTDPALGDGPQCAAPRDWICRMRNSQLYRGFFYALTHWLLPTACAILIVYAVFVTLSGIAFAVGDSLGLVCRGNGKKPPEVAGAAPFEFDTRALCQSSGLRVVAGRSYKIALTLPAAWEDGHRKNKRGIVTDPNGFGWEKTRWTMIAGILLRRELTENWFRTVVRVGATGSVEQPLSFTQVSGPTASGTAAGGSRYEATFKADASGEVFLFVNDSVIGFPWIADLFYRNNAGTAKVFIAPAT